MSFVYSYVHWRERERERERGREGGREGEGEGEIFGTQPSLKAENLTQDLLNSHASVLFVTNSLGSYNYQPR